MTHRTLAFLLATLLAATAAAPAVAGVDLAPFLKRHDFEDAKISPTGEFIAATVPLEDRTGLVVLARADKKLLGSFALSKDTHIAGFTWVNPTRLVLSIAEREGSLDQPQLTGELYAVDADGSKSIMLAGTRVDAGSFTTRIGRRELEDVAVFLVDELPDDDKHVLVAVSPFAADPFTRVETMDVYSGRRVPLSRAPVANGSFTTDHRGWVRMAWGYGVDNVSKLYHRKDAESEWTLVNDEAQTRRVEWPIGFAPDNRTVWLRVQQPQGPDAIVAYDTESGTRKDVLRDADFDPHSEILSFAGNVPVGVRFRGADSRNAFFDENGPEAGIHRALEASFPGQRVTLGSSTRDGKHALLLLDGPDNPGDYFLFDVERKHADYLMSRRRWMDPAKMAPTRPVTLPARDGLPLHGFLTTPRGSSGKGLPLVVMPHGGPFGVQDWPDFDDDAEILARAGYAVLRINFRGSSGRGRTFLQAGARQWGGAMQDDVTDATRWAIAQGIADEKRVCIFGASYGGYAAMMGLAREPGLYRCGVGHIGVYDLPLQHAKLAAFATSNRTWVNDWIGPREGLDATSPVKLADRIKAPVFLAAGELDERVDVEHTRRMEKALRAANVPVQTLYAPTEGHGFYTEANRRAFYTQLLAFLSTHLGGQTAK